MVQGLKHSGGVDVVFTVALAEEPVELHVGQFHLASVNLVDSLQFGVQCEVGSLRSVALYAHYGHHIACDVGHDDVLLDNLEWVAVCRTYVVRPAPRSWLVGIVLAWIGYRDVVVLARGKVEVAVGNDEASVAAVVVLEHRHVGLAVGCICGQTECSVVLGRNECCAILVGLSVAVVVDTVNGIAVLVADTIEEFRLFHVDHSLEGFVYAAKLERYVLGSGLASALAWAQRSVLQYVELGCLGVKTEVVDTVVGTSGTLTHIVEHNAEGGVVAHSG